MAKVMAATADGQVFGASDAPRFLDAVFVELESQRVAALKAFWLTSATCLLLIPLALLPFVGLAFVMIEHPAGSGLASLVQSGRGMIEPYLSAVVVGAFIWFGIGAWLLCRLFVRRARQPVWNYIRSFKLQVFTQLCDVHFPGLSYDPEGYIGYDRFDATKLFPYSSDAYNSEDYFSGRVGQTDVHFAEVVAKRERRRLNDGSIETYLDTFFRGLVFVADFHKHFHSSTRLVPRGEKLLEVRGQETVILEDPEFEAAFATLSTDPIDARYVLSTSMVSRFVDLKRRIPGLRALFEDEKLVLVLPSDRDHLEPSLYCRATSSRQLDGFVRDICSVLRIVEALNLNTRIWSKR